MVPERERDDVPAVVAPLMPALGAVFAVFTAITLSSEAGYLQVGRGHRQRRGRRRLRLAWAATSPGVVSEPIQTRCSTTSRPPAPMSGTGPAPRAATTRPRSGGDRQAGAGRARQAARTELGTPVSTELLASVDAVTSGRRARIAAASREIPALYVLTLVASGMALISTPGPSSSAAAAAPRCS